MIEYLKGNLLESDAEALVNTVNTVGIMGKGLALQFKERFPNNYHIYHDVCKKGGLHIGEMLITEEATLNGKKTIINFPTKTSWRKPSEYIYIEKGLIALKKEIEERQLKSIAIPPLGTRNGGLDWNRVKEMIQNALQDLNCCIQIYEPSDMVIDQMKKERVKLTPARAMMMDVICDMIHQGEFASEFSAEKIVYFLQRFGAENIFRINFHHGYYGPYSGKVRYLLRSLNGSYLMGLEEMNQKPFEPLWIAPDAEESVNIFMNLPSNQVFSNTTKIVKIFLDGFYSSYSLELLATVDYVLQTDESLYQKWQTMDICKVTNTVLEDISNWSKRKKQLFGDEHYIQIMLNHLKEWQNKMETKVQ